MLTIAPTGGTSVFSGQIGGGAGDISVVLNGNGTQWLSGVNTYSGPTVVDAGCLGIGTLTGTGAITLNGGTLEVAGPVANITSLSMGTATAAIRLDVGGALAVPTGTLSGTNGTILGAGGTLTNATMINIGNYFQIANNSTALTTGQTLLLLGGSPGWAGPEGYGLHVAPGSTFTMSGGSMIINGVNGPSCRLATTPSAARARARPCLTCRAARSAPACSGARSYFGLPGGNTVGLFVGGNGAPGIFNQSGGLVIVHGFGAFDLGSRDFAWGGWATPAVASTGTYNLSGGTLNTSEGAGRGMITPRPR